MANLSKIRLEDLFKRLNAFKRNLGYVFWLIFIIMLVLEVFTIKTLAFQIIDSYKEPEFVIKDKGVRVDFEAYNKAVEKISNGQRFFIEDRIEYNPFGQ